MAETPFHLKNKTVIMTGGASGIGAAITELFAASGARVIVGDINTDAAQKQHADSAYADNIEIHYCDISMFLIFLFPVRIFFYRKF